MKYKPACTRSIFAPSRVISINVGISVASKHRKKASIFRDENVKIKKKVMIEVNIINFFWVLLSFFLRTFFAVRHSGINQHLNIIKGVDILSEARFILMFFHVLDWFFNSFMENNVNIENEQIKDVHFHRFIGKIINEKKEMDKRVIILFGSF